MARYKGKDAVKRWAKNVEKRRKALKRFSAFAIFEGIRDRTPVDTGVAAADWRLKAHAPDDSPAMEPRPYLRGKGTPIDPPPTPRLPKRIANDSPIFITNPQRYIEFLENGTSDQAPAGMVAITLEEWRRNWPGLVRTIRVEFEGSEDAEIGDEVQAA